MMSDYEQINDCDMKLKSLREQSEEFSRRNSVLVRTVDLVICKLLNEQTV